ncbi:hypothetical protein CDAR_48841 [Caerostris darwini]|uniref:Uncharacterized protein n=1 Tax=Caerostris darwini TaxID=1538125 RepID=A0AAV4NHQ9_9ARAC|nr:hypothetical protein CDAR_48841 [Caerostris darwini]
MGVVEDFKSKSSIPGVVLSKSERWIFNCIIRRKGQTFGKGYFISFQTELTFRTLSLFRRFLGTRKGLKNFRLFRHQKVILIVPDRSSCSSTLEGGWDEKVQGKER